MTKPLEQRIVAALANPNNGSEPLAELIRDTEAAAAAADRTAVDERAKAVDLLQSPDPKAAHQRVVDAEISRDRLKASLPKLREKLTAALEAEHHARWLNDYRSVKKQLDEAVTLFNSYREHSEAIAQMFAVAVGMDREVSRINLNAPDGENRRLPPVELAARGMTGFTRDNPSLATTVVLPRWDASARTLWPQRPTTSLAAEVASSMVAPPHPYPQGWGDPAERERRRDAKERDQARSATFHEQAALDEEDRKNAEERQKLTARRR